MKNSYNLCDGKDRNELFNEYLIKMLPCLNIVDFDDRINFLCSIGLSDEWLNVTRITVGDLVCPNNLKTETSVHSLGITNLLNLARQLAVFDDKRISHYIQKLNTQSFGRISVLSEIKISSAYLRKGYKIDIEPSNQKRGKSGLEGRSDLRVNLYDEWIYFEITHENYSACDSSIRVLGQIGSYIEEQIIKHRLIPRRTKIDPLIVNKNKVLSKYWGDHFIDHLRRSPLKMNTWKEFEGVQYILKYRRPDEVIFMFSIPITDIKKGFVRRIKHEVNQVPKNAKGVIAFALSMSLNMDRFTDYAQKILGRGTFSNILAIIIWYGKTYQIICNRSLNDQLLEFLAIPFIIKDL